MERLYSPGDPVADRFKDIGTLWSMTRNDSTARCALWVSQAGWELRVLVDGYSVLVQQCDLHHEVFSLAEQWRQRMVQRGWAPARIVLWQRPDRRRPAR